MLIPRTGLLPLAVVALLGSSLSACSAEPEAGEGAQESADVLEPAQALRPMPTDAIEAGEEGEHAAARDGAEPEGEHGSGEEGGEHRVENTTGSTLCSARVEVHLSTGVELGPTEGTDIPPGASREVVLPTSGADFDRWTAHPEVSSCGGRPTTPTPL